MQPSEIRLVSDCRLGNHLIVCLADYMYTIHGWPSRHKKKQMKFFQQIREDRKESQESFAKSIGVPRSTYVGWEMGRYIPNAETLVKVYRASGWSKNRFFSALIDEIEGN